MSKKYGLIYTLSFDDNGGNGYDRDEVLNKHELSPDVGATDALFMASIIRYSTGELSVKFMSADSIGGEAGLREMDSEELFKVWSLLGFELLDDEDFSGWKRDVVIQAGDYTRRAMGVGKYSQEINDE